MIAGNELLAQKIHQELDQLERAVERARMAMAGAARRPDEQDLYSDAAALNIHAFYAGLERLLGTIARQLDGGAPAGDRWHRELLQQMALPVPRVRPAVLRGQTVELLDEYRRFRHLVRNVYSWSLDPHAVDRLTDGLEQVHEAVRDDLRALATFLREVSAADDELPDG
jgi:hypothetical protein